MFVLCVLFVVIFCYVFDFGLGGDDEWWLVCLFDYEMVMVEVYCFKDWIVWCKGGGDIVGCVVGWLDWDCVGCV